MKLLTQLAQAQQQAATAAAATETEIDSATPKHASDKVSIQADPRVTTADCGAGTRVQHAHAMLGRDSRLDSNAQLDLPLLLS
eukprot:5452958-Pleurochrysis_carterae.AAC.2